MMDVLFSSIETKTPTQYIYLTVLQTHRTQRVPQRIRSKFFHCFQTICVYVQCSCACSHMINSSDLNVFSFYSWKNQMKIKKIPLEFSLLQHIYIHSVGDFHRSVFFFSFHLSNERFTTYLLNKFLMT